MRITTLAAAMLFLACIRPLPLPGPVMLLAPADDTTLTNPVAGFAWAADTFKTWEFQLAIDGDFKHLARTDTVQVDGNEAVEWPVDLRTDGAYWWRVRARNTDGVWGTWSDVRSLVLGRFEIVAVHSTPGYAQAVCAADGRVYVADGQAGLAVFDVSNPETPAYLGTVMDSLNEAFGIAVRGGYAYVAYGYKELAVISVADPDSLRIVGELEYPTPGNGFDLAVRDTFVYIAADAQFIVVDVASPPYPNLRFQYRYPRGLRGIALADTLCYLALEQLGVAAWNVATLPPVQLGSFDTPSNARDVAASGEMLYIADGRDGLVVADASDPASIRSVATLALPGYATQVTVHGRYAYVGCGDGGLVVVDIGTPAAPHIAATVEMSYTRGGQEMDGYVYACDRDLGLVVIRRKEQ